MRAFLRFNLKSSPVALKGLEFSSQSKFISFVHILFILNLQVLASCIFSESISWVVKILTLV